jgi:hypothetical protein
MMWLYANFFLPSVIPLNKITSEFSSLANANVQTACADLSSNPSSNFGRLSCPILSKNLNETSGHESSDQLNICLPFDVWSWQ